MNRIPFLRSAAIALALCAAAASPSLAQTEIVQPTNPDADSLADQIRALATNPRDIHALLAAGDLSARLGDTAAALAFFARAEAVEPGNPRILAGRASALVRMERPGEALSLFRAAEAAGLSPSRYASDRGFAYDLLGAPHLAQRDYRLALQMRNDDETERRFALSLGITGKVEEAMAHIDVLLRKSDRAAWRARAFILAMNGDIPGAERIAARMLPGSMGAGLSPFFRRLAVMSVTDRAFAVHFGEVSSSPARVADARMAPAFQPYVPEPKPVELAQLPPAPPPAAAAPNARDKGRRSRDRRRDRLAPRPTPTPAPPPVQVAMANPLPQAPAYVAPPPAPIVQPLPTPTPAPVRSSAPVRFTGRPATSQPVQTASNAPIPAPPRGGPVAPAPAPTAGFDLAGPTPAPALRRSEPLPLPAQARVGQEDDVLASIVRNISIPASELEVVNTPAAIPAPAPEPVRVAEAAPAVAKPAPKPVVKPEPKASAAEGKAAAKVSSKKPEPKKPDPKKQDPSRIWVQVAGGANEATLPATWKKLAKQAPAAFKGKSAWTTPLRATNRLLAGPFKNSAEAQGFVNQLKKEDMSAFVFTSEAGQKITKLAVQ